MLSGCYNWRTPKLSWEPGDRMFPGQTMTVVNDRITPYTVTEIYDRNTITCNTAKYGRIRSFMESVTFKLGCRILRFDLIIAFCIRIIGCQQQFYVQFQIDIRLTFEERSWDIKKNWKSQQKEAFEATDCRTSTARSDAYIHQYSRSFELIAYITNCRVFILFGEIFRTEILLEILYFLFSTLRVEYI